MVKAAVCSGTETHGCGNSAGFWQISYADHLRFFKMLSGGGDRREEGQLRVFNCAGPDGERQFRIMLLMQKCQKPGIVSLSDISCTLSHVHTHTHTSCKNANIRNNMHAHTAYERAHVHARAYKHVHLCHIVFAAPTPC